MYVYTLKYISGPFLPLLLLILILIIFSRIFSTRPIDKPSRVTSDPARVFESGDGHFSHVRIIITSPDGTGTLENVLVAALFGGSPDELRRFHAGFFIVVRSVPVFFLSR